MPSTFSYEGQYLDVLIKRCDKIILQHQAHPKGYNNDCTKCIALTARHVDMEDKFSADARIFLNKLRQSRGLAFINNAIDEFCTALDEPDYIKPLEAD